jgi:hypothetical protein
VTMAIGGREEDRARQAAIYFERHHANVQPDAGFAGRVAARLQRDPAELLGWAALRLLPISILLALVLGWASIRTSPVQDAGANQTGDQDVIAWILDGRETSR